MWLFQWLVAGLVFEEEERPQAFGPYPTPGG